MSDSEETTSTTTATTSTLSTTTTTSTAPVQLTTTTTTAASPAQAIFPMQGIHPPGHLDVKGNIADNWKSFKQQWSNYAVITNIHQQPEAYKVALFLHCIGPEALKIFNGMSFDNAQEREQLATIIKKFDEFTIGETNETYERYVFNSRNQSPEETIDAYVATLRTLAQTCNFCECLRDSLIRDRIVLGIFNPQTRKRLLQERKLTLNKCIDICRSTETTASQMKAISGDKAPEDVNRIDEKQEKTRPPRYKRGNGKYDKNDKNNKPRKSCLFCGGIHPFQKGKCPAWGHKCRQCGGRNHFANKCKKPPKRVNQIFSTDRPSSSTDQDEDVDYITSIEVEGAAVCSVKPSSDKNSFAKEIYSQMLIDDAPVKFQVDCGSSINILPKSLVGIKGRYWLISLKSDRGKIKFSLNSSIKFSRIIS